MDRARHRRYDREYADRRYADPLEIPPEPVGFWGLSRRSRPWAREEDRWGTSGRARERESGRGTGSERAGRGDRADRRPWGAPGYGWGSERRIGAYERPPREYGRGERDWWARHGGGPESGVRPSDETHGTGAWGPGQAEPGLWPRGAPPRGRGQPRPPGERGGEGDRARERRSARDRESDRDRTRQRARERDRERALERERERARQGARERWGRSAARRPDVRRGEAWGEMNPGGGKEKLKDNGPPAGRARRHWRRR